MSAFSGRLRSSRKIEKNVFMYLLILLENPNEHRRLEQYANLCLNWVNTSQDFAIESWIELVPRFKDRWIKKCYNWVTSQMNTIKDDEFKVEWKRRKKRLDRSLTNNFATVISFLHESSQEWEDDHPTYSLHVRTTCANLLQSIGY